MKKAAWRNRIKKACQAAGTYREYFDTVIDTLADILEKGTMRKKFLKIWRKYNCEARQQGWGNIY